MRPSAIASDSQRRALPTERLPPTTLSFSLGSRAYTSKKRKHFFSGSTPTRYGHNQPMLPIQTNTKRHGQQTWRPSVSTNNSMRSTQLKNISVGYDARLCLQLCQRCNCLLTLEVSNNSGLERRFRLASHRRDSMRNVHTLAPIR